MVNGLRETIEAIRRDNEAFELREAALVAEQTERLAQMEAQNAEADTALLDLEEKLQTALLEFRAPNATLKENKEMAAAIAVTLAFALVRSEGTAAGQDQDLDDASADTNNEWWSEDEENVETIPYMDKKDSVMPLLSSVQLTAIPGGWAPEEVDSRDLEQSPVTETEDTHPCPTAVKEQGNTRKPSKSSQPSKPTKLSNAHSMSDDVPVRPSAFGAMLQELKRRLAWGF